MFYVNREKLDTWFYDIFGVQEKAVDFTFARGVHTLTIRHDLDAYVASFCCCKF